MSVRTGQVVIQGSCEEKSNGSHSPFTVHQVLNRTSGLHDYAGAPKDGNIVGQSLSPAQVIAYMAGEPLDHPAGTRCCDVNADFPIEEAIVERITGTPYAAYLQQHELGPLGLTHTGFYQHLPPPAQHALGYQRWQVPAVDPIAGYEVSALGGMMYTTVTDYYRWVQALHSGRLLSAASTRKIVTLSYPARTVMQDGFVNEGTSEGWSVARLQQRRFVANIGGYLSIGMLAADVYDPAAHITLIVLGNDVAAVPATFWASIGAQIYR